MVKLIVIFKIIDYLMIVTIGGIINRFFNLIFLSLKVRLN